MRKIYILNGFSKKDDAIQRITNIDSTYSDPHQTSKSKIHCLQKEEWGIELQKEHIEMLSLDERSSKRLKEYVIEPTITPYIPVVYRYLEEVWVDHFFKTGELRISSFRKFSKHTDEQRGDSLEGYFSITGIHDSEQKFQISGSTGDTAYVFCTSLMLNKQMAQDFNVECCFAIEKPLEFINLIGQKIPGLLGIDFGPCLYKPNRDISRNAHDFDLDNFKNNNELPYAEDVLGDILQRAGSETLFSKTNEYAHQHEYRFLWHSDIKNKPDYIDIKIPEAIPFCRKIKFD